MNCKLCPPKSKRYCSVRCNITNIENRHINENGCWITKRKKPEVYFDGKPQPLKKASWIYIKKETYDKLFRIRNNCNNISCYNPDHLEKIPLKNTICRYCDKELTKDNTKSTKLGSLYPYCRECYYRRTEQTEKKTVCKHCKKPLTKFVKRYCNEECNFKNYIVIDNNIKCWLWVGPTRRNNPTLSISGNKLRSSRKWSFLIFSNYSIDDLKDMYVIKCKKNQLCVNYLHLTSKISNQDLQRMKLLRGSGWTYKEIGEKFDIHQETIRAYLIKEDRKELEEEIATYLICHQCNKEHDNLGVKFCSQECMNLYLLS